MRVFRITKETAPLFAEFIPEYVLARIDRPGFHTTGEAVTDGDMYYAAGFLQYYDGEMCEQDSVRLLYIYVPEDELAVQVAYSLADPETAEREVGAITKLTHLYPCRRRVIVTYDEEGTLTDKYGTIEVIPCWKWLLKDNN